VSNTPLVDSHAHIWTADMPKVANPRHALAYDFTVEQYLAVLDQHGVKMAVLAAASPFGDYNDYMVECLRRHPRLRGTVILEPSVERIVMDQMKRDGVVGVRLFYVNRPIPDMTTFAFRRFLRRIRDLDWHVHLHVEGERLPQVMPVLLEAGVKLVLDHLGRPDPATGVEGEGFQCMLRAIQAGRCWVKMSGAYRLAPQAQEWGRVLVREAGPERLVWASDCPFAGHEGQVTYQETIDWLINCVPDPEARRKIFGETAMGLYFS